MSRSPRDLARRRLLRVLDWRRYCSVRQLEKKISEAGPEDMRPDPYILTQAIKQLLDEEQIRKQPGGKGLPLFYTPATFNPRNRTDAARRQYILKLYRKFFELTNSGVVGKALERVVFNTAVQASPGNFTIIGSPDDPVKTGSVIDGKKIEREPDLLLVGCGGPTCIADIEVKNLREWLSAQSEEVWNLIGRALRVEAVPVLITRKILGLSFYIFQRIGLLAWQLHFQFFPPETEDEVADIRDKDGLGFSDIRCSDNPPPTLVRYFGHHLPRLVPAARDRFLASREILSRYAIDEALEHDIPGPTRSRLFDEFRSELLEEEADIEEYLDYDFY